MEKRFYEPAHAVVDFDGENYFDSNGLMLVHPNDYNYGDGFFSL